MKLKHHLSFLLIACLLMACDNKQATNTSTSGIAKISCDESFQNILDQEVQIFEYTYPDASIMVNYTDEASALDSLLHRRCDLIITSRDLTKEQHDLLQKQGRAYRSRRIAVDALAVIVNNANDIDELSVEDLRDIFTGKVRRWGEVFPTRLKRDSIQIVLDQSGSGIVHYLKEKFTQGKDFGNSISIYAQNSSEEVFKAVTSHKNAIGFVGVSWITSDMKATQLTMEQRVEDLRNNNEVSLIDFTDRIKVMAIRGDDQIEARKPYQAWINDGSYPLFRSIWAIDASAGGTLDHGFYSFLTGVIGQKIILQTGILPAAEPVRMVETVK
ncbi:MAG: substrate-binding domain-containing protein [Muribaculaceae bacterium]|nr:substrate-binding domain-containing protein [Muribaculaceae bacterium]